MFNKLKFLICFLIFICFQVVLAEEKDEVRVDEKELILEAEDYFETPQWFSLLFRGGEYVPNKATGVTADFQTKYGSQSGVWFETALEVQPVTTWGVLGVRAGTGVNHINGGGNNEAKFIAIPINVGLVYHFKYFRHQFLVPFVEGGGSFYFIRQIRQDTYNRTRQGVYASAGVQLNLNYFERRVAERFDLNYGINNTYLTAEFRYVSTPNAGVLDLTGGFALAGFMMEF